MGNSIPRSLLVSSRRLRLLNPYREVWVHCTIQDNSRARGVPGGVCLIFWFLDSRKENANFCIELCFCSMARNVCCRTRNQKVTLTPRPCMATVRILSHSDVTETFSYLSRQTSSRENMGTIQKSLFAVSLKPEKIISFALHRSGRKNRNFRAVHST